MPNLNINQEELLMKTEMVLKTTLNWININLINSERWSSVHQLRICIILITEKCQVILDSETLQSQELTHGLTLWLERRLSMRLESQLRQRLKSLRLRASQEFNLTPKSICNSMRLMPIVTTIPHQSSNFQRLPKRAHMNQERLLMPMEMALKIM